MPPGTGAKVSRIMESCVKGVDHFLPTSRDSATLLMDYGVPEEKITVVTRHHPPDPSVKAAMPERLSGKEAYLMVNRLVKEKGVYDVLYGWRLYMRRCTDKNKKVLVVIGEGSERKNMERLANEWKMGESIAFLRQLPYGELLGLYKGAKCLILGSIPRPDWQEQFGYVLGEAMCSDVPVIATYSGAIPEVVGRAGLLIPPAHPIALAEALGKFDDSNLYQTVKAACAEEKKKFAVGLYADTVTKIYRRLIR